MRRWVGTPSRIEQPRSTAGFATCLPPVLAVANIFDRWPVRQRYHRAAFSCGSPRSSLEAVSRCSPNSLLPKATRPRGLRREHLSATGLREDAAERIIKAVMAPNEAVNAVGPVSADQ